MLPGHRDDRRSTDLLNRRIWKSFSAHELSAIMHGKFKGARGTQGMVGPEIEPAGTHPLEPV